MISQICTKHPIVKITKDKAAIMYVPSTDGGVAITNPPTQQNQNSTTTKENHGLGC
jgi:hypothetical protein